MPTFFKGINVNGLKDDKARLLDFPVPEEIKTKVSDALKHFTSQYDIDVKNPKHLEVIKDFAKSSAKSLLYDKHIIDAVNKTEQRLMEEFHNPSNINRSQDNPNNIGRSAHQKVIDALLE